MQVPLNFIYVGASRYDFKNENGERLMGAKVKVISVEQPKNSDYTGYVSATVNAPFELFDKLYKLKPLQLYTFVCDLVTTEKGSKVNVLDVQDQPVKAAS